MTEYTGTPEQLLKIAEAMGYLVKIKNNLCVFRCNDGYCKYDPENNAEQREELVEYFKLTVAYDEARTKKWAVIVWGNRHVYFPSVKRKHAILSAVLAIVEEGNELKSSLT